MSPSSSSSIFPALFPNQGNEPDSAEVLALDRAVSSLRHFDQLLHPAGIAHRHDDASGVGKLLDHRLRNVASARGSENGVERRMFGTTLGPVALDDCDIVVAKTLQPLA